VRFEQVSFAYDPARPILHDVSFEIPAGKTVAVVGPSARARARWRGCCTASTTCRGARITIDGRTCAQVTQASLRAAIGIVPQDTVLFNDTVATTSPTAAPAPAARRSRPRPGRRTSTTSSPALPKGYDTMVGERGLKLSGGEKQRVAIAAHLLKNPPILIFDEATSALDSANERAIQAELRSVAQGKTALVIAHRLSTVVDAHEIVVLEAGPRGGARAPMPSCWPGRALCRDVALQHWAVP
jgi:ABC-type transport system involved in Fe-S cluster assembly fused permease/ATPase subunit